MTGAAAYFAVLRRLGPVWASSEVKKVFADGPEVCVVYDFVTNTPAGKVDCCGAQASRRERQPQ